MNLFQILKPTMLIGSSGQRSTFTKEVLEALASFNEVEEIHVHFTFTLFLKCKRDFDVESLSTLAETCCYGLVQSDFSCGMHSRRSLQMDTGL